MTSYRRIAAVKKTVDVLRHLAEQDVPVPAATIAEATEQPYGSVMCLLATLEDEGMVRSIGDRWELGFAVYLLRAAYRRQLTAKRDAIDTELNLMNAHDAEMKQETTE